MDVITESAMLCVQEPGTVLHCMQWSPVFSGGICYFCCICDPDLRQSSELRGRAKRYGETHTERAGSREAARCSLCPLSYRDQVTSDLRAMTQSRDGLGGWGQPQFRAVWRVVRATPCSGVSNHGVRSTGWAQTRSPSSVTGTVGCKGHGEQAPLHS